MNLQRVVVTKRATEGLAALPADVRLYVKAHLANLDALLALAPLQQASTLWEKNPDDAGFVAYVRGARIVFAANAVSGTVIVSRIERYAAAAR